MNRPAIVTDRSFAIVVFGGSAANFAAATWAEIHRVSQLKGGWEQVAATVLDRTGIHNLIADTR